MGDDKPDEAQGWLPPSSDNPLSVPPPGAAQQGDTKWGAPAPPPAPGPMAAQPDFYPQGGSEELKKATTSMILGIVGLILCPIILSTMAIVYGNDARKTIDNSGGRYSNRGKATAGIVLGWVGLALMIFWIVIVVAAS